MSASDMRDLTRGNGDDPYNKKAAPKGGFFGLHAPMRSGDAEGSTRLAAISEETDAEEAQDHHRPGGGFRHCGIDRDRARQRIGIPAKRTQGTQPDIVDGQGIRVAAEGNRLRIEIDVNDAGYQSNQALHVGEDVGGRNERTGELDLQVERIIEQFENCAAERELAKGHSNRRRWRRQRFTKSSPLEFQRPVRRIERRGAR